MLLDIDMPDINGYDTCRRFREQLRGADVPIIFVSAHDTTPERVAAYEAGGDDFLTKPLDVFELIDQDVLVPSAAARDLARVIDEAWQRGPAGAAAAVYAARKGIRTGIVAERFGGQTMDTLGIENFISVQHTEGPKLAAALELGPE